MRSADVGDRPIESLERALPAQNFEQMVEAGAHVPAGGGHAQRVNQQTGLDPQLGSEGFKAWQNIGFSLPIFFHQNIGKFVQDLDRNYNFFGIDEQCFNLRLFAVSSAFLLTVFR